LLDRGKAQGPLNREIHSRIIGIPRLRAGSDGNRTVDRKAQLYCNLGALDRVTTRRSRKKLRKLGLGDVADKL
jgi:hypothetical protein